MRILVTCEHCQRTYDASDRPSHSRFRCHCGEVVTVPAPAVHDAAMTRCGNCGAPLPAGATECGYCHALVADHERDRNTVCPKCLTRVSDHGRFCHSCGHDLRGAERVGTTDTNLTCPCCPGVHLVSRPLAGSSMHIHECPSCAGMWLSHHQFDEIAKSAKARSLPPGMHRGSTGEAPVGTNTLTKQRGPLYRQCPECGATMNRRNYARVSGIVIDACKTCGVWFDADELAAIVRWVEEGGLDSARAQRAEQTAVDASKPRPRATSSAGGGHIDIGQDRRNSSGSVAGDIVGAAVEALADLFFN